jgi:hypothetical protein
MRISYGPWMLQLGLIFMAFGAGGFLGFAVGRAPAFAAPQTTPAQGTLERSERHANNADYLTHRLIAGVSKIEKSSGTCR